MDIDSEVIAELAKEVIKDPQTFLEDINYNPTIVQKIADLFKNIAKNFKNFFTKAEKTQISKAYDALVKAVRENRGSAISRVPGIQYDIETSEDSSLVAVHNLSESKFKKVLDLGGFVMPSIAVTKAENVGDKFGDISILFDKSTISPTNRLNQVYSRDAYTPKMPKMEILLNPKIEEIFIKMLGEHKEYKNDILGYFDGRYGDGTGAIVVTGYEIEYASDDAYREDCFLAAYLLDNSKPLAKNLQSKVNKEKFDIWFNDVIKSNIIKKGLRNNKERYTNNGRRNFAQLHDAYTIENVLKYMMKAQAVGGETMSPNISSIAGALSRQFESIEDIKNSSNLIEKEDVSKFNEVKESLDKELDAIVSEINIEDTDFSTMSARFDEIKEVITQFATMKKITASNMVNLFNREMRDMLDVYYFDYSIAYKVMDLFEKINQLPTQYFEAKPKRIISFDEINSVLIPKGKYKGLVAQLKDKGIKVQYYSEERTKADIINKSKVKFDLDDDYNEKLEPQGISYIEKYKTEQYNNFGWVVVNDVLSTESKNGAMSEYALFNDTWAKIQNHGTKVIKSKENHHILEIYDKLVYTKGSYENPKIDYILELDFKNEIEKEIVRSFIYDIERKGAKSKFRYADIEGIAVDGQVKRIDRWDFKSLQKLKQERRNQKYSVGNAGSEQNRRRNFDSFPKYDLSDDYRGISDADAPPILKNKVFLKTDAKSIANEIIAETLEDSYFEGNLQGSAVTDMFVKLNNAVGESKARKEQIASDIADVIMQETLRK